MSTAIIKRNDTNTDLVEKYMNYFSPLCQVFLIEGVRRYAELVISQEEELKESMKNHIIDPHSWVKCAKDWIECEKVRNGE